MWRCCARRDQGRHFDEAAGRLEAALPQPFTLTAEHEKLRDAAMGPAEFSAVVDAGGVSLRGRIADERMRDAVESLCAVALCAGGQRAAQRWQRARRLDAARHCCA